VVGVLNRFPTLPADSAGFLIADQTTLAAALDAQLPGQGRPDELWISTGDPARLRAALGSGALAQLDSSFRADIDHQLQDAPVAAGCSDADRGDGAVRAAGGRRVADDAARRYPRRTVDQISTSRASVRAASGPSCESGSGARERAGG
jgi:hypothetical protein